MGQNNIGDAPPFFHRRVGKRLPTTLRSSERATERCKAVLIALARLGAGFKQRRNDLRTAEESSPTKSNRIVFRIEERHVGAVIQKHLRSTGLIKFSRHVERICASDVRLAHRVGQTPVAVKQQLEIGEITLLNRFM